MSDDIVEWEVPEIGDHVTIVNETYETHDALVTAVHGTGYAGHPASDDFEENKGYGPSINVVYVSSDPAKRDPYGNQLERLSSLSHYNSTINMPKRGRYWIKK